MAADLARDNMRVPMLICRAMVWIGLANFAAFMLLDAYFGGSALNGKIDGDQFFLGDHGRYVAVSRAIYEFSLHHGRSLFITHPLAGIASWILHANTGRWM
jgi:hypothetical protein